MTSPGEEIAYKVRECSSYGGRVDITYECFGNPADPALLLVCGLNSQLTSWDTKLCGMLARAGPFYVIRFDNRDVGLSTHMDSMGSPSMFQMVFPRTSRRATTGVTAVLGAAVGSAVGNWVSAVVGAAVGYSLGSYLWGHPTRRYSLHDMALDAFALMDKLFDMDKRFHVVGVSMGGMIAQTMAIHSPTRVLSLTSCMSTTGAKDLPQASLAVKRELSEKPASPRMEDLIPFGVRTVSNVLLRGAAPCDEYVLSFVTQAYARTVYREGRGRHIIAIVTQPDREPALRRLAIPTLVIHGKEDVLMPLENGRRTAQVIPDAKLVVFEGMSHFLAPADFDRFVVEVVSITRGKKSNN